MLTVFLELLVNPLNQHLPLTAFAPVVRHPRLEHAGVVLGIFSVEAQQLRLELAQLVLAVQQHARVQQAVFSAHQKVFVTAQQSPKLGIAVRVIVDILRPVVDLLFLFALAAETGHGAREAAENAGVGAAPLEAWTVNWLVGVRVDRRWCVSLFFFLCLNSLSGSLFSSLYVTVFAGLPTGVRAPESFAKPSLFSASHDPV